MIDGSACTFISLDKVVKAYLKNRPIVDYQAEARRVAHYYGAGSITENGEIISTEDAEVISITTVRSNH